MARPQCGGVRLLPASLLPDGGGRAPPPQRRHGAGDPRRLRRVYQALKGYGAHWQFSVFFCALKPIARVRLQADLEKEMNLQQDQALIIDLGPDEDKARQAAAVIGQPLPAPNGRIVVV